MVDEGDEGSEVTAVLVVDHAVQDGAATEAGEPRVVSQRLQFASIDRHGQVRDAGPAPHIDLRAATPEESYEIVRRRLFQEVPGDRFHHRDNTLKQFAKLYRESPNDFPQGSADEDYRRQLDRAYPIHAALFDQLFACWGTLERFQRTRGVLRLMAQMIHELWMTGDPSVMIMPGSVPLSTARVEPELLHYLDPTWQSIFAADVDGPQSTPCRIDQQFPNLNRFSATRRVARAVFLGTAPVAGQDNKGLDDKQINHGVVQPGEKPQISGDAMRRLASGATFMHGEMGRYWYSEAASLNRLAADRAAQIEAALVDLEVNKALKVYVEALGDRGHFEAVHVPLDGSADVPDEAGGVRAVVMAVAHPHDGRDASAAMAEAKDTLLHRGAAPRVNRNALVFLAADDRQLGGLKGAMRASLAWSAIVSDADRLIPTKRDEALARAKAAEARRRCAPACARPGAT